MADRQSDAEPTATQSSAERSRAFYRHLGAAGLASRTKPEWDGLIVDALLEFLPASGGILDVGCGYGRIALPLAERGFRVTGLDIAPNLLRAARRDAMARGLPVRFDQGSMTDLPYPDAAFDACICLWSAFYELLEPREQVDALRQMRRVLRAGGVAIVEGPAGDAPTSDDRRLDRRLGPDLRLTADLIVGRRYLQFVHDETTLLQAAAEAGVLKPRVAIREWAGRPRQLLLFSR